jgi:hypothetical protein
VFLRVFVLRAFLQIPLRLKDTKKHVEVKFLHGRARLRRLQFSWLGYQQDDKTRQRREYDRTNGPPPETDGAISPKIAYAQGQYDIRYKIECEQAPPPGEIDGSI